MIRYRTDIESAIITAILRIGYLYQKSSIFSMQSPGSTKTFPIVLTYKVVDFTEGQLWSAVHLATGVVCASAPIYKPLWSQISHSFAEIRKRYQFSLSSLFGKSSKPKSSNTGSVTYISLSDGYQTGSSSSRVETGEAHKDGQSTYIVEGVQSQKRNGLSMVPGTGILRSQQFEVSSAPSQ